MTKTTQQPQEARTPSERSLEDIERDFAATMRRKVALEAEREKRHAKAFAAQRKAQEDAKALNKALEILLANDPATQDIGQLNAHVDDLKIEAAERWEPLLGATHRADDGAGFQYRDSTKTVIANEESLAKALIDQHLWQDIGASLSVSTIKAARVLKTHSLPGLGIEPQVTVAAYGPSKE